MIWTWIRHTPWCTVKHLSVDVSMPMLCWEAHFLHPLGGQTIPATAPPDACKVCKAIWQGERKRRRRAEKERT